MTQANVTLTVRKASDTASILDIKGEVTAFAENALMDAYTQASTDGATSIVLNFRDLAYMKQHRDRSPGDAAHPGKPAGPAVACHRTQRALPAYLRPDPPQRGHQNL